MSNILIVVALVVIFVVAFICPRMTGKIEKKTDDKANWLKRLSNWFWDPLTWWAKKSIGITQKVIKKDAEAGKKTRKKV